MRGLLLPLLAPEHGSVNIDLIAPAPSVEATPHHSTALSQPP